MADSIPSSLQHKIVNLAEFRQKLRTLDKQQNLVARIARYVTKKISDIGLLFTDDGRAQLYKMRNLHEEMGKQALLQEMGKKALLPIDAWEKIVALLEDKNFEKDTRNIVHSNGYADAGTLAKFTTEFNRSAASTAQIVSALEQCEDHRAKRVAFELITYSEARHFVRNNKF